MRTQPKIKKIQLIKMIHKLTSQFSSSKAHVLETPKTINRNIFLKISKMSKNVQNSRKPKTPETNT
jgi:hypothetical protein